METVTYRITGTSPLLMNNPKSMLKPKEGGAKVKTVPSSEEEAETKVYRNGDGQLYFPTSAFRSGIVKKAATGRRIGKIAASTVCSGSIFPTQDKLLLYHPGTKKPIKDYDISILPVVIQGNRIARSRPELPKWAGDLELDVDTEFLSVETVTDLLNIAGRIAGAGDYRPAKSGTYGRYTAELIQS